MAAVSPRPQTTALNLSIKGRGHEGSAALAHHHQRHTAKPIQRVQPNDFCRGEDGRVSPVDDPHALLATDAVPDPARLAGARMPELIVSRKQREFIPDESKDVRYWDRRRKNNDAAKRSRQKRRFTDIVVEAHMMKLARENDNLKAELMEMKERVGPSAKARGNPGSVLLHLPPAPINPGEFPEVGPSGTLYYNPDAPASFQPDACASKQTAFTPVARPRPYPATSLGNSYPSASGLPPHADPKAFQRDCPQLASLQHGPWSPLPGSRSSIPPDAFPENGATLPWHLDGSYHHANNTLHNMGTAERDEAQQDSSPHLLKVVPAFSADKGLSSRAVTSTQTELRRMSASLNNSQPSASPPVKNGAHATPDKPPSPHSAFTSGLELSKLPHKLREKMKRSLSSGEVFADRSKAASSRPPSKMHKSPSSEHSTKPMPTTVTPSAAVRSAEDDIRSVCLSLDASFTPPPSSSSSSDGNASPVRGGPLFDFSVKSEHLPRAPCDAALSESHERMVRAAHALAALNKSASETPSVGGSSPAADRQAALLGDREKYWDKRRRNNQAAKKCRDAKRLLIDYRAARSAYLEQENSQLRCETSLLQQEVARLKELVKKRVDAEAQEKPSSKFSY